MPQQTAPATAEANGQGSVDQLTPHPDAGTGPLDDRLARIVGAVSVTADAKMKVGGGREFSYATIDQMAGAIGRLLAVERVTISPVGIEDLSERELVRQKQGDDGPYDAIRHLTSMTVVWRVAANGESFEARSRGKSADPDGSEKDVNQAHSFARINLYKSMFHLVTGEDPERKTSSGGSGGGSQHSGELPSVEGATVNGSVVMNDDGTQVGLDYTIEPRPVQVEVNRYTVQVLGGQWNRDGKLYAIPSEHAKGAVTFARYLGLVIPENVAARFPAPTATPSQDPAGPVAPGDPDQADQTPAPPHESDDIPF